ncbi:MAG: response regulator [Magnetococcales bacterium]|nr:response regulator [Magnetococcales bacterium]
MKTLIVDDVVDNRVLLKGYLASVSHCDLVKDGFEAVGLFEDAIREGEPYDLVLLDIMMPEMDGQETLKRLRQLEQDHGRTGSLEVAILMVTAIDSPREAMRSFFDGYCTDYLVKPVSRQTLFAKLSELNLIQS